MKINKWAILLVALFANKQLVKAQQNIQFTQYIFNSISVNPAYAGYKEEWYAQLGLRSQWINLDGAPKTGSISIDGVIDPISKKHGVGLDITSDKLGAQSATSAYANYAFRIQLDDTDESRLSLGIAAGVTSYSLDGSLLHAIKGNDPLIPANKISNYVPDIRLGVYYNAKSWYLGASVMDLMSGTNASSNVFKWDNIGLDNIRRKPHLYVIGGGLINLEEGLRLRPSFLLKEDFKGPTSLDVNAMLVFQDKFWIGGGIRTGVALFDRNYAKAVDSKLSRRNSFSGIVQLHVSERLRIGYSYDHVVNRLSSIQNGSHEITMGMTFGQKDRRILSPRFF